MKMDPPCNAITGADGKELSDRWGDGLFINGLVQERWESLSQPEVRA